MIECAVCGRTVKRFPKTRKYCSTTCRAVALGEDVNRCKDVILRRDNYTCIYCAVSYDPYDFKLHVDHVVPTNGFSPTSRLNQSWNLVTACYSCNIQKGRKELEKGLRREILLMVRDRNLAAGIGQNMKIILS